VSEKLSWGILPCSLYSIYADRSDREEDEISAGSSRDLPDE